MLEGTVSATTLPGSTTTITAAVELAEDGDTILIKPGTYDESITITKDITVRGDGDQDVVIELSIETWEDAPETEADLPRALHLDGSRATVEKVTFRGDSSRIVITGGAPLLRDLDLDGIGTVFGEDPGNSGHTGVEVAGSSTPTIEDSRLVSVDLTIEDGASPNVLRNEWTGGGIWLEGSGVDPHIEGNTIDATNGNGAISAWGGARPTIVGNTIRHDDTAISVEAGYFTPGSGSRPTVIDDTIEGGRTGINVPNARRRVAGDRRQRRLRCRYGSLDRTR